MTAFDDRSPSPPDPALLRGLTHQRVGGQALSRRDVLRLFGAAGGVAALSACGIGAQGSKTNTSKTAVANYWTNKSPTGTLNWANWPLYLDTVGKSDHPTLNLFTKQTGTKVNYYEAIQDNGPFFAKVQPSLSSGQYTGYDLAVISSGIYFNKLRDLGFLIPLDQSRLTNFRKYAGDRYKSEAFDPGNVFSIPYQAGFTGIGYDPAACGRDITSWEDLNDPKFTGKIGMFANNEDLPNCALVAIGVDPLKSTESDWHKAAAWLDKQKPLVRQYYSQNYIEALATGDVWITMAWSGDVFQQNLSGSNLKFVIPKQGGLLWTDNFLILKEAQNPVDAMLLMDFYYKPDIAAMVTEYVNYVSPVPAAEQVVRSDAAKATKPSDKTYLEQVGSSFATFPKPSVYANTTIGYTPKEGSELDTWNSIFEPVYQS
ncbi:MAG: extracellular solute-binding protein [Nocardioidaceae bacterium]